MWFLLVAVGCLAGCKPIEAPEKPVGPLLVIEPAAVDFGAVPLGETGTASVTLRNEGEVAIAFDGTVASSDDLVVDDPGPFELQPGDEELRTVSWTAATIYGVDERIDFVADGVVAARIPVTGSVSWAPLEVPTWPINFVDVNVGCETWVDLTVRNDGTGDDALTAISVSDPAFAITSPDGAPLDLPLTVSAGSDVVVRIHFAPMAPEPASGTLVVDSESTPALAVIDLYGEGLPFEPDTKTWTVEHDEAVTGIINVNTEIVNLGKAVGLTDQLHEFVQEFFRALLDAPQPFRVAIVMHESGHPHGPVPYIDHSFSLDDAVAAADVMLEGMSQQGDNDNNLETCFNAIPANRDWLLEDDPLWLDSNLNLVAISHDSEQSPYDAAYYVDRYLTYKEPSDLAVHGIAGDLPEGCIIGDGWKSGARPSVNLYDATIATGGAYLSICDPDWAATARTLAWRFTAPYVLDGAPSLTSIEVLVDGVPVSSGWSYDDTTHELTFDDPSAPDEGAELRVDYARCD